MLYTNPKNNSLSLTEESNYFLFNTDNVIYIKDGTYSGTELQIYIPTTQKQQELKAEYDSFVETNSDYISANPDINAELIGVDYWKEFKNSELTIKTDLFEQSKNNDMYFTSSLGFRVNGDRRSLTNITSLIEYFDLKQQDGTIGFKDYDNDMQRLTKEQLQTIKAELVINSENLYSQKWNTQLKITQAQDLDALNAIEIKFDMMDFTPESDDSGASIQSDEQDVVQTLATLLGKGV